MFREARGAIALQACKRKCFSLAGCSNPIFENSIWSAPPSSRRANTHHKVTKSTKTALRFLCVLRVFVVSLCLLPSASCSFLPVGEWMRMRVCYLQLNPHPTPRGRGEALPSAYCFLPTAFCFLRSILRRVRIVRLARIDSLSVDVPRSGFDVADVL
jgi:hypothetical protein